MLRPPTVYCLERLLAAADWADRDLDRALCDVGVLPPVELSMIRNLLAEPGISLSSRRNAEGHTIIEVARNGATTALIHPDGRVHHLSAAI